MPILDDITSTLEGIVKHKLSMMPPDDISRRALRNMQGTLSRTDVYSSRPGYGLTPERIYRVFRDAEAGNPREQCDLFEDLKENDGHLWGLINGRIEGVVSNEALIAPGDVTSGLSKRSADVLASALARTNLDEFTEHQLEVFWTGYQGSEVLWDFIDGWWVPVWFYNAPGQRFRFGSTDDCPYYITDENPYPGEELSPSWVFGRGRGRRAARSGAGRCAAWFCSFKRMGWRDWIVFAEKFGIPIPIGVWDDRTAEETRKVVEQAVRDIGEAGQAVMSNLCKIVFAEVPMRSGDPSALHPAIIASCNAELSKLINGSTLTTETGGPGSFALGKVHEARSIALMVADAKRLGRLFKRTVGKMFNVLNGLPSSMAPPELDIEVQPDMDPLTRVQVASILANELGMELDEVQIRRTTRWRAPVSPATAVKGTKKPEAPAGAPR